MCTTIIHLDNSLHNDDLALEGFFGNSGQHDDYVSILGIKCIRDDFQNCLVCALRYHLHI